MINRKQSKEGNDTCKSKFFTKSSLFGRKNKLDKEARCSHAVVAYSPGYDLQSIPSQRRTDQIKTRPPKRNLPINHLD